jgi:hypothetical protein
MAKKSGARSGARRKARPPQRHVELLRQTAQEQKARATPSREKAETAVSAVVEEESTTLKGAQRLPDQSKKTAEEESKDGKGASGTARGSEAIGSAATRSAVPRRDRQRSAGLITPEHYAYVRRDLVFIAILATIMFAALIALHFVPALGG